MMNEQKQVYPKRMLAGIKAVKERRRQERMKAIQASSDLIKKQLATPSKTRVAAISPRRGNRVGDPYTQAGLTTPSPLIKPVLTNKARRYARKRFKKLPHGLFPQGHVHEQRSV